MTLEEAAAYLAIKPARVSALRRLGKIKAVQVGGSEQRPRVRYTKAALDEFLAREERFMPTATDAAGADQNRAAAIRSAAARAHEAVRRMRR